MNKAVGIDIGGTNTKVAVMDRNLKLLEEKVFKTPVEKDYSHFINKISEIVENIAISYKKISLCIGIAGDIDSENGVLRFSPNLKGWKNKNIKRDIEKITGIKCKIENDANMAAWGSYVFDLKRKAKNVVVLTLGTGVGGGIIVNGKLYKGFTSTAGELGHIVIKEGGLKCQCGNYGCLEAYCGEKGFIKVAREKIKDLKTFINKYSESDNKILNVKMLFNAAKKGNAAALELFDYYGKYLGCGIGSILVALNPEYIVLSGGISKSYKFFMPSMLKSLGKFGIKTPVKKAKIVISKTHNIGVLGCAAYSIE